MFSVIPKNVSRSDFKAAFENSRQTRPFEFVRTGSSSNIPLTPGYRGNTVLKDSYYFTNILFDSLPFYYGNPPIPYIELQTGDRILLYGQTNTIENGIWSVINIIDGYVNIQRPVDYAKNTPIRCGQCVLIYEGYQQSGIVFKNTTPEYDGNQNKIISYNGTSPQNWVPYVTIFNFIDGYYPI